MKFIITTLCLLCCAFVSNAQKNILKLVADTENSPVLSNEVYSQKRHPVTNEIFISNVVYEFKSNLLAQKFLDAFRKDRAECTDYRKVVSSNNKDPYYNIKFNTNWVKYDMTLMKNGKDWIFTIRASADTSSKSKDSVREVDVFVSPLQ